MNWLERVKVNVFLVSEEKREIRKALGEWVYKGYMYDVEVPEEVCELCNHPNIRYQFEIVNSINNNRILIGSECINKFKIDVVDKKAPFYHTRMPEKRLVEIEIN